MNTPVVFPRKILSFMRREGRMSSTQKQALASLWSQYGLEVTTHFIDFDCIFQRIAPRILEIGFGMGQSLFTLAKENPDKDFIGVEVHRPGVGALIHAANEARLTNIKVFCADAITLLNQCIANNSLDRVQLFFPDPWPKRRHHKRRIMQPDFVRLIHAKLKVNGIFHCATDWQDYADHMLTMLENYSGFINQAGKGSFSTRPSTRPKTKFEERGLQLGHKINDLIFIKS